ncbi:hypothetical protein VTK73DRAFT_6236 [Phialemonium thermophilum]|uniref:Uncharacterized protein n=1 Tax=Phialemonium thermophilum TaxID=223376 RepID=A0ABR3WK82_9PEZI
MKGMASALHVEAHFQVQASWWDTLAYISGVVRPTFRHQISTSTSSVRPENPVPSSSQNLHAIRETQIFLQTLLKSPHIVSKYPMTCKELPLGSVVERAAWRVSIITPRDALPQVARSQVRVLQREKFFALFFLLFVTLSSLGSTSLFIHIMLHFWFC